MSGTTAGGKKSSDYLKAKFGDDFFKKIGAIGGKNGNTGGFHVNRELARTAGKIGGSISKRRPKVTKEIT